MKNFSIRINEFIRRGYALLFAFVFILIILISALPPLLMAEGHTTAGRFFYRGFYLFCHQYPWRSWFLRGSQPYYPQLPDGKAGIRTFEEASGFSENEISPKTFYGTAEMGYKMAICQRDTANYGAMALFAVLFFMSRYRIKALSWKLWLLFGVLPLALDGGTQLLSRILPWFAIRESTPLLRTVTGALFGFMTCWFLLPTLEKTLQEGESL